MQTRHILIAATLIFSACHKEETVHISDAHISVGQTITSDTLSGAVKGTLAAGKTYYFRTDVTINQGDTLLMQAGAKLIAIGDGKTTATSPQITCNGTFISLGTADANNFITVADSLRKPENIGKGYWGGIQCGAASGDVIIKWTHLEFAGGPAGPSADPAVFAEGDPRNLITYTNYNGHFILEDSWLYGSTDDGIRILHGNVSVMRNTFEANGKAGGEALNLKAGSVGDVAYNLVIGAATNAFKVSNSGGGPVQTKVYLYNNTILNCGMRQVKSGRGGSINYEKGAQGKIYNNIIVDCRYGMRITPDADTTHTTYNNQFFYSNAQTQIDQFYTADGVGRKQSNDIMGAATPESNAPMFASYDVNQFDFAKNKAPLDISAMPFTIITAQQYDFSLLPGSPALKSANADVMQAQKTVPQGGLYGATTLQPSVDMGAYPSNGSGNQHITSSLLSK
ncbi:hypothetical protein [Chitinophaga filiformis]|uniref:Right handed beta helix region n=1 Tax=Chitinophaga filiformis TaxID=104663 RepID=A0A1G7SRC3_CHIFI|nr:hypothetical protein [Chitinophaga filiformis]SDG24820.1 hypothetical protein SAMN04488121_103955 [Chitinophaga filiformis]